MTDHTRLFFLSLIILGEIHIRCIQLISFSQIKFIISSLNLTKLLAPSHVTGPCELRSLQAGFGGWAALDCGGGWLGETQLPLGTDFP